MDLWEHESKLMERQREQLQRDAERAAQIEYQRANPTPEELLRIDLADTSQLIGFVFGASREGDAVRAVLLGGRKEHAGAAADTLRYRLRFKETWSALSTHAVRSLWRLYEYATSGSWSGTYPDIEEEKRIKQQEDSDYERKQQSSAVA